MTDDYRAISFEDVRAANFDFEHDRDREARVGDNWSYWRRTGRGWLLTDEGYIHFDRFCRDDDRLIVKVNK